ncbi:MAG: C4-type zinc ribbon domain-containing protein [Desulfuromonadales bacterium]|nr:C4-type zinc ribbon domain-containing protein [Desulfuromonadales bacterium]
MHAKLSLLEDLQEMDIKADKRKAAIQGFNDEIAVLDARLQELESEIAGKNSEFETLDSERKALEENLATENANIQRSETNLKGITTQKEYQAVNKEISTAKKLITELEDQILQLGVKLDELKAEIVTMEKSLEELRSNLSKEKEELASKIKTAEDELDSERAARAKAVKAIPAMLLKHYEKLRIVRKGAVVVEVRNQRCMGCNMQIPPQMYNTLHREDEVIACPHCQRILIMLNKAA